MELAVINPLPVGEQVFFENEWWLISDVSDIEYTLLSIVPKAFYPDKQDRSEPKKIYCNIDQLTITPGKIPPKPVHARIDRSCDIMDCAYYMFIRYIGNRQKPAIEWAYYISSKKDRIMLISKEGQKLVFSDDSPIKKVFYFHK